MRGLESCVKQREHGEHERPHYIVILQDDVWSTEKFMEKLIAATREVWANQKDKKARSKILMLKLFVTSFWQNFETKAFDITFLILSSIVVTFCFELFFVRKMLLKGRWSTEPWFLIPPCLQLFGRRAWCFRSVQLSSPNTRYFILFSLLRVYFATLAVYTFKTIGKQNLGLSDLTRVGIRSNPIGASALGMVYPVSVVPELIDYLVLHSQDEVYLTNARGVRRRDAPPLDVLLRSFVLEEKKSIGGEQYVVVPTLLQHTGQFSSSAVKHNSRFGRKDQIYSLDDFYREDMKFSSNFEDVGVDDLEKRTFRLVETSWDGIGGGDE